MEKMGLAKTTPDLDKLSFLKGVDQLKESFIKGER